MSIGPSQSKMNPMLRISAVADVLDLLFHGGEAGIGITRNHTATKKMATASATLPFKKKFEGPEQEYDHRKRNAEER